MTINSNILKITGGAEINAGIDTDKELMMTGTIQVYETALTDNQDGTFDRTYKGKFVGELVVMQGNTVIRAKDKTKTSVKNRAFTRAIAYENSLINFDDFYEDFYKIVRSDEHVKDLILSKLDLNKY